MINFQFDEHGAVQMPRLRALQKIIMINSDEMLLALRRVSTVNSHYEYARVSVVVCACSYVLFIHLFFVCACFHDLHDVCAYFAPTRD